MPGLPSLLHGGRGDMSDYITIEYLYRDTDNYKCYDTKVFGNPSGISPELIRHAFVQAFRQSQFFSDVLSFDPALLGWKPLFFDDPDIRGSAISLHEIGHIEGTQDSADANGNVDELLRRLAKLS
jgi:hypothetical protein